MRAASVFKSKTILVTPPLRQGNLTDQPMIGFLNMLPRASVKSVAREKLCSINRPCNVSPAPPVRSPATASSNSPVLARAVCLHDARRHGRGRRDAGSGRRQQEFEVG